MKTTPRLLFAVFVTAISPHLLAEPPANTYIPDLPEAPVFTPPPPVVPNTPLPDAKVTLVLRDDDGLTTTVQRGQASMAPDPPVPAPAPPSEAPPHPRKIARPQIVTITMAGTVYDHRVSVVAWQHPLSQQSYEAVVGFDIGLLAPIGHFIHQGVPHDIQLSLLDPETRKFTARRTAAGDPSPFLVPRIAPDAYRITQGDPTDPLGIQPLLTLRDLYLAEKPRLRELGADLADYQQDAQAWADSHPAPIEPPIFWFKPHRNSRYLTPQDRSDQQQAAEVRAEQAQEGEIQP